MVVSRAAGGWWVAGSYWAGWYDDTFHPLAEVAGTTVRELVDGPAGWLAATVYIFGLERYRPFVRPAILTAFLGYVAVAIGLLYDLGLPWHIWHPMIFPQHHSVLFEVAMCVMLYLTVLALEFSPAVLEHPWFDRRPALRAIHRVVRRLTIPLVIAGIVLSTLHQSSLGSLFLIQPFRVHPLWYSPILPLLFFVSGLPLNVLVFISFYAWGFSWRNRLQEQQVQLKVRRRFV